MVLGLKDQNRVKKTLSMGTAHQILARANCACTIVRPMFSAGDHLRIQAKLQPDVIVANSAMQFRRRVAVVMNSSFWDSALAQYAALKVILPGDRVILVRCLNENINKKNVQDLQVERDYLRELGWHKFKKSDVSLAVEVVKSQTRMLCEFLEEKGVDLVIMSRFDSNKLKRSIKKGTKRRSFVLFGKLSLENASFQSFPHRCPCPIMIASTEVLRPFNRFLSEEVSDGEPFSPFSQGIFNRKTWSNALSGSHFRPFRSRRCQSMDIGHNQNLRDIEFGKREDSIEMSSSAMPDYAIQQSRDSWQSGDLLLNRSPTAPETSSSDTVQEDEQKEAVVRQLQQKLSEKEQEILHLKQCLSNLQNN